MTQAYPLQWPQARARRPAAARKQTRFNRKERQYSSSNPNCSWMATSDLTVAEARRRLQEELDRIGARFPVISSNLETRLDGMPRSGQREPADPGVAVYFELGGSPHCLPCDTYTTVAGNIAAVAAHIEATRAIERHGVASVREMFSGFAALPAPKSWWEILGVRQNATRSEIESAFRLAARRAHPDSGGSNAAMAELNDARAAALREIEAHHGL